MPKDMDPAVIDEMLAELEAKIQAYNDVPGSVTKVLETLGLSIVPTEKVPEPVLPEDISALSMGELNRLYDACVMRYDYIIRRLAKEEGNLAAVVRLRKLVEAALYFKYKGHPGLPTAKDRDNAVVLDWQFIKVDAQHCHFSSLVDSLNLKKSSIGQSRDRVYREINRRTRKEGHFSSPKQSLLRGD